MPEFATLDKEKSISWKLPANGSAGLARSAVSTSIRPPAPPAWMIARIREVSVTTPTYPVPPLNGPTTSSVIQPP